MNGQASRLIELNKLAELGNKSSESKIISVCSGKGGTGKTFFSANFSYQLSKLNKRVLLVDLDYNFSNLNILMNQTSSSTISDFFEQSENLENVIYNYSSNLDLVFGDSGKPAFPRVSRELIDYLFTSIRRIQHRYDFIILDSSAGADGLVLQQLMRSDYNIIVTSPEPTAVMDSYVVVKLLVEKGSEAKRLVVVNKCSDAEEGENSFMNLSVAVNHFLKEKIELLGFISLDASAHKSIMNQELLLNFDRESKSAQEIYTNSAHFITIAQVANNNHR